MLVSREVLTMRLPLETLMEDWPEEKRRYWTTLEEFERNADAASRSGRRQLRLIGCGCCRLIWAHLEDPRLRQAVEAAERYADFKASVNELRAAREAAESTNLRNPRGFSSDDPHAQANTLVALVVGVTKAEEYATAGIEDFWVLDVVGRQMIVFRTPTPIPDGGAAYRDKKVLGENDTVTPLATPNAVVKVADLLP
jgi:hypothetical protein